MDQVQMFYLRWAGPVTLGAVLAVVAYVFAWVNRKKWPGLSLTLLVGMAVFFAVLTWRFAFWQ